MVSLYNSLTKRFVLSQNDQLPARRIGRSTRMNQINNYSDSKCYKRGTCVALIFLLALTTLYHQSRSNDFTDKQEMTTLYHQSRSNNFTDKQEVKIESKNMSISEELDRPRILLYITSHMSTNHEEFLHRCWPYVLSNSKLVQMADVTVFLNGKLHRQHQDAEVMRYVFREKLRQGKLSIQQVKNLGNNSNEDLKKQEGAILAMAQGHKNGWFEGYDWVVRVNPDVIIRNDTLILETILSSDEENVTGLFVDCVRCCVEKSHCNGGCSYIIHSDFTVFKPTALSPTLFWNESNNAELMNNVAFASVLANGQDRWLVDAAPDIRGQCRISERDDSPVTHYSDHSNGNALRCVTWYRERNMSLNSNIA